MRAEHRRRRWGLAVAALVAVAAVAAILLATTGSGTVSNGAARVVPADALAFADLATDTGRADVTAGLTLARRFPDAARLGGGLLDRVAAVVGGSPSVTFAQIRPWLGGDAGLAVLNTPSASAATLIALAVADAGRARAFLRAHGAVSAGSDRGVAIERYASGTEVAFASGYLVAGADAGVRAAIDVARGAAPALSRDATFVRASAADPPGAPLQAYASAAGLRRVVESRGGALGALATLVDRTTLAGVAAALVPEPGGAAIRIHSVLDPALVALHSAPPSPLVPTLLGHIPAGATLVLDTSSIARLVPRILQAGAVAGIGGRLAPLLARLGQALSAEGVDVAQLLSLFAGETVIAVVPAGALAQPAIVLLTRSHDAARAATLLAELEAPLAQLFGGASGQVPVFNDRTVDGVTAHQLALAPGLSLAYAVSGGLVAVSSSLGGLAAVLHPTRPITSEAQYQAVLGGSPTRVGSLLFLDFSQLLSLGEGTGLTRSAGFHALTPDLEAIRSVGLTSTSGEADTTAELHLQIP